MKLELKLIAKIFYLLYYMMIFSLFIIVTYYSYLVFKCLKYNMPILMDHYHLKLFPMILSVVIALMITILIAELSLSTNMMWLSIDGKNMKIRSLFKKYEYDIEKCKLVKTKFMFGINNTFLAVKEDSIWKRHNIRSYEFRNYNELNMYLESKTH